jgi:hypothetical protein
VTLRSVTVRAELRLVPIDEGGLPQPLEAPTPSLVFRFVDSDETEAGLIAIVDVPGSGTIAAGTVTEARVTFPDAPPGVTAP